MAEHETTADVIAEMRRGTRLPGYWRSCDVNEILQYHADRLEAAIKRERAKIEADALEVGGIVEAGRKRELSKNLSKNASNFGQLGNTAKLREALVQAELFVGNIVRHGHQTLVPGDKCTACEGAEELRDMICAALAEPVRNYEVGTVEEQYKRFMNMCNSKDVRQCAECSMRGFTPGCSRDRCFANWAQLPYTEGGAE